MRRVYPLILIAGSLAVTPHADAQSSVPPRWDDLPKQFAPAREDFEKEIMEKVGALLRAEEPTTDTYRLAETVLTATLRHHQSVRRPAPLVDNPAQSLHAELEDRLANVRKDWLLYLQKNGDDATALRLAEQWLPGTPNDSPLRAVILLLWVDRAKGLLGKADFDEAQKWLNRLEANFAGAPQIDEIRQPLRERAQSLLKKTPDQTLLIAVRSLPEQLSPATAWTEVERQSLELLFDRLCHVEQQPRLGKRYRPQLALTLPNGSLTASMPLRRDVYWSTGKPVTDADVRHTALLMNQPDAAGRSALWRDFLDIPRLEGNPFHLNISYKQGLFDPLAPLTFWVLPRFYRDKELPRADDPEFAKAPVGSGPFQLQSTTGNLTVFQANPYDVRLDGNPLREIRMTTWTDPSKDLAKPLPHLILDAPTDQLAGFKKLGYKEVGEKNASSVQFLAVNHRKPSLASVSVRRAIAHALDRQALLNKYFPAEPGKYHSTANGIFPHESWANAPAPRVPAELYQAEQARSFARKAKKESGTLDWTLKYPAGDPRVKAVCEAIGRAIVAVFQEAEIKAEVQVQGLPVHALRKAIHERDYDLLYTSAENLDDPVRLALFFDRQEDATRPGGSNILGYDNDVNLHDLLRAARQHRQFSTVQENMRAIHVYLAETMPLIPLWQLDTHVLVHPSLRTPPLDPRAVFANIRQWKIVQ
jgi:ABC-type oligopeptide transport system substrate-binding subunit